MITTDELQVPFRLDCPGCGHPWWLGVPVSGLDPISADGLTEEGRRHVDEWRARLAVCADCRTGVDGPTFTVWME